MYNQLWFANPIRDLWIQFEIDGCWIQQRCKQLLGYRSHTKPTAWATWDNLQTLPRHKTERARGFGLGPGSRWDFNATFLSWKAAACAYTGVYSLWALLSGRVLLPLLWTRRNLSCTNHPLPPALGYYPSQAMHWYMGSGRRKSWPHVSQVVLTGAAWLHGPVKP